MALYSFKGRSPESDDDYLDWSDDEDIICNSKYYVSSDEEDDDLNLFTNFRKPVKICSKPVNTNNEEDEFEKEMASELSATMTCLTTAFSKGKEDGVKAGPSQVESEKIQAKDSEENDSEFYDDVYFDSDDSEAEDSATAERTMPKPKTGREKRRILSNDELFYDPQMDDRDQQWMDAKRRSYQIKKKKRNSNPGKGDPQPLPQSDAVLNCPACLTTLCMDCQRHAIYNNQYRAMFVFNCTVDWSEGLKFPTKGQKKKEFLKNKRKNKYRKEQESARESEEPIAEGMESSEKGRECESSMQPENSMDIQQGNSKASQQASESSGIIEPLQAEKSTPEGNSNSILSKDVLERAVGEGEGSCRTKTNTPKKVSFEADGSDEIFHPVMCNICNTKVAVYDKDEVYHFFNVVTSY
ncbi:E2F-associated phosphoprotein-like [Penaeus indicus]|uniref:E2F-associated phosphoprotein-like n=1 Tax=Penaeus indicus TaxID=29960 RepID=UPI00300CA63D